MPQPPSSRSVRIGSDERGGWSSDRPRPGGRPERPADVSVRCRVLAPADRLRYAPGSLLVVVSGDREERDRFAQRVVEDRSALLSMDRVRALLAGRVAEEEAEARAAEILGGAVAKRLEAGDSVVVAAQGLAAAERERYVRLAAARRRPRHLILLDVPRDRVAEEDRPALNALRRALDAGELGAEGFHTALRLSAGTIPELKRVVFRPPPADE